MLGRASQGTDSYLVNHGDRSSKALQECKYTTVTRVDPVHGCSQVPIPLGTPSLASISFGRFKFYTEEKKPHGRRSSKNGVILDFHARHLVVRCSKQRGARSLRRGDGLGNSRTFA